jgi:hypothetical protein
MTGRSNLVANKKHIFIEKVTKQHIKIKIITCLFNYQNFKALTREHLLLLCT